MKKANLLLLITFMGWER